MLYIDSALLSLTELCCRKFQVLTGRTNVWLAVQLTNLSIILYFVWAGLYSWRFGLVERVFLVIFCGGLAWVLTQTLFAVPIEASETAAYQRVAKGLKNPRRIRDFSLRMSFLGLSVVLCYPILFVYVKLRIQIALLSYLLIVLTSAVLYVLACDPLPPCSGRLTEWVRGVLRASKVPSQGEESV